MKMRTHDEVQSMIDKLNKLKKELPEFSFFGDPNHLIIDTQIDVLNGDIVDEDEIYEKEDMLGQLGTNDVIQSMEWLNGEQNDFEEMVNG